MVQLCEQVAADEGSQNRGEARRSEGDEAAGSAPWCPNVHSYCLPRQVLSALSGVLTGHIPCNLPA